MSLFHKKKEEISNPVKISPSDRRQKSNQIIMAMGIKCFEQLPMVESSDDVTLRSMDEICDRAVACLLATQVACDIENDNYEESKEFFSNLLKEYDVYDKLIPTEKRLFEGDFTQQDVIDVAWTYESYWSLVWALGLIDDISDSSDICDCEKAIQLVCDYHSMKSFKKQCSLRNIEEILDMVDLYYRYHWAVTEKRLHPETPIANLNPEVVMERRRGLEWLISKEDNWFDISMDT